MKILHLITSINTGGAEKFCIDLCNTQVQFKNIDVYLCVLDSFRKDNLLINKLSDNVQLISLNKSGGYSIGIIFKLYKLIKQVHPDIIHTNGRALIYASIPIIINKIPSVYTVHTLANKEYNNILKIYLKVIFNLYPTLFNPVGISKTVLKTIQNTYGKHYNDYIYNGSSRLERSPLFESVQMKVNKDKVNKNTMLFLYIGRIAPEKNVLLLIKTFTQLIKDDNNILLYIIGYDSTSDKSYLPICKENNIFPERIKFLGEKINIYDYLYFTDALCMTSNYEGLGIVALEAFSLGKPVISTPSGGPNELIINGINGYLSESINVQSFMDAINLFINTPISEKIKIKQIYEDKFTMKKCAVNYISLYTRILQYKS